MKRYPKYKDSGIDWLGEIPEHWEIEKIGTAFEARIERVNDTDYPPLSVTMQGIVPQLDSAAKTIYNDNRKRVAVGDFVINSRSDRRGASGLSELEGSVSVINIVLKPKKKFYGKYLHYLFRSYRFTEEFYRVGRGIVDDLWTTKYSMMRTIDFTFISFEEQKTIACFIDRKLVQIDQFISNKQRFIELLKEQKRAIINRAVTKGLNPDAPMKPSGIEWLGDIPESWEVRKLKRSINRIEQGWSPLCHNELAAPEQWGVLKVGAVNGGIFRESENKALPNNLEPINHYEIREGDVLISRANTRELLGSAAVVQQVRPKLILCDKLYRVKLKDEVLSKYYLIYMLVTRFSRYQMESAATGSSDSMQNISQETIKDLKILLPPIAEQNAITTYINEESEKINLAITKAQKEIELIQEYRTTLISDAVTGKIDVRELTHNS